MDTLQVLDMIGMEVCPVCGDLKSKERECDCICSSTEVEANALG